MTWDALGRVLTETAPQGTVSSQYDLAGRRTRVTLPGATTLYADYVYDLLGNTTFIRENGATSGVGVLATYQYDSLSRRSSVTFGNGVVQNYTYDNASRLATQTNDLAATANDLTQTFSYNPASQITSVTRSNDLYAWTGHSNANLGSTPNGLNQIGNVGAATVTHDTKGNITAVGTDSYGYSSENFLTSGPGSATLSYDPMGRLYQVAQGASTTRMGYDGLDRIAEYDGSNVILRRYIHGPGVDNPIAWYEGSGVTTRRFLSSDERGSVISVTDGSGTLLSLNKYDEFGIPQSTNLGKFGYTGQAWVPEIGLWYYKARFLWSDGGRFMQTDPLGYEDGMNWYVYAGNNPIMFADPLGLSVASGFTPCVGDCSGTITGVDNGDSTGDFVISVPRPTGERNDYQMQKLMSMSQAMYMTQRAYNFVTPAVIGRFVELEARNEARKKDISERKSQTCTVTEQDSAITGGTAGATVAVPHYVHIATRLYRGATIASIATAEATGGGLIALLGGPVTVGAIAIGVGIYAYDRYSGGSVTRFANRQLSRINARIGEGCQ